MSTIGSKNLVREGSVGRTLDGYLIQEVKQSVEFIGRGSDAVTMMEFF